MWVILGASEVPVSVNVFARVRVTALRTISLSEFDFRFQNIQARGPQHAAVTAFYTKSGTWGEGGADCVWSAARCTRAEALGPRPASRILEPRASPSPHRARTQVVSMRTLLSSMRSRQRDTQTKGSPEVAGISAFYFLKWIGISVSIFVCQGHFT